MIDIANNDGSGTSDQPAVQKQISQEQISTVSSFLGQDSSHGEIAIGLAADLSDRAIADRLKIRSPQVTKAREELQQSLRLPGRKGLSDILKQVPGLVPKPVRPDEESSDAARQVVANDQPAGMK